MTNNGSDYLRGKDGRPIVDRYGRPIRRRSSNPDHSALNAEGTRRQADYPAGRSGQPAEPLGSHSAPQPAHGQQYQPRYEGASGDRGGAHRRPESADPRGAHDNATRFDPRPGSGHAQQPAPGPDQRLDRRYPPAGTRPAATPPGQDNRYGTFYTEPHNQPPVQRQPLVRPSHYAAPPAREVSEPSARPKKKLHLPSRRNKTTKPRKPARWGRRISALLGIIVLVLLGTLVWVDTSLNRIDALESYPGRVPGGSGTNWLLVGTDSRDGLTEEQQAQLSTGGDTGAPRTDSIILVHVPLTGKATMVSLPRDSYVNIPGQGMNKINAAFAYGGPQLLQQTVEQATGLRIDHYAEIGFGGFAGVVDAVGGVNICVEQEMDDPLAGINLQPGCQTMDGATALGFVRSRHSLDDGDIGRARNQRTFLSALVKKALSPGVLLNPFRFFPFVSRTTDAFTVNTNDHVWNLMHLGLGLVNSPNTESVPVGSYESTDVGDVIVWDETGAQNLFSSLR